MKLFFYLVYKMAFFYTPKNVIWTHNNKSIWNYSWANWVYTYIRCIIYVPMCHIPFYLRFYLFINILCGRYEFSIKKNKIRYQITFCLYSTCRIFLYIFLVETKFKWKIWGNIVHPFKAPSPPSANRKICISNIFSMLWEVG